jgi:PLP dependent protein
MSELQRRVLEVRARIQRACESCGRPHGSVELLPISKRHPVSMIQEASTLGFDMFGENYVQEGSAKAESLPDLGFTLIGPLQRNKAKSALLHFREIMTVDRLSLLQRLRQLAAELDLVRGIWLQVNLWGEATKMGGCPESGIGELLSHLEQDPRLPLQGLMAIPPPESPSAFQELAHLRETWQQNLGRSLRLSMGMSDDLEVAIRAGSDQVRIGTALFGARA